MVSISNFRLLGIICALVIATGCASLSQRNRLDQFGETSKAYGQMVFWSQYEEASAFRKPGLTEKDMDYFEQLKDFKVTAYNVKSMSPSDDKKQIRQVVVISYYRVDEVVVRTLRDQQLWIYDDTDEQWYLEGELPNFQ